MGGFIVLDTIVEESNLPASIAIKFLRIAFNNLIPSGCVMKLLD
jgi:hypothetical protein